MHVNLAAALRPSAASSRVSSHSTVAVAAHYFLFFPHYSFLLLLLLPRLLRSFLTVVRSHIQARHTTARRKHLPTHTNTHPTTAASEEGTPFFFFFLHHGATMNFFSSVSINAQNATSHCFTPSAHNRTMANSNLLQDGRKLGFIGVILLRFTNVEGDDIVLLLQALLLSHTTPIHKQNPHTTHRAERRSK